VTDRRTILGVFAHPDDESMGPGATFAKYARAGHRVLVATATEGGAGRLHEVRAETPEARARLKSVRRAETAAATAILGIEHLGFLGWEDQGLRDLDVLFVEETIAAILRRTKPDVVVTFHGSGISYHKDHRVITLATMGAFLGCNDPRWWRDGAPAELPPHAPSKLYVYTVNAAAPWWKDWPRTIHGSSPDEITTIIDTRETADAKWAAIQAHDSQKDGPPFRVLRDAGAFDEESFVRIFPSPRAGERKETDLLEGLD
jgi:N-acetyl-1-D-myo-inositol-2-amino-2-deoxy-alpha-D-glucopyranoside deacetylase/mycothiol S-conjugate amidase